MKKAKLTKEQVEKRISMLGSPAIVELYIESLQKQVRRQGLSASLASYLDEQKADARRRQHLLGSSNRFGLLDERVRARAQQHPELYDLGWLDDDVPSTLNNLLSRADQDISEVEKLRFLAEARSLLRDDHVISQELKDAVEEQERRLIESLSEEVEAFATRQEKEDFLKRKRLEIRQLAGSCNLLGSASFVRIIEYINDSLESCTSSIHQSTDQDQDSGSSTGRSENFVAITWRGTDRQLNYLVEELIKLGWVPGKDKKAFKDLFIPDKSEKLVSAAERYRQGQHERVVWTGRYYRILFGLVTLLASTNVDKEGSVSFLPDLPDPDIARLIQCNFLRKDGKPFSLHDTKNEVRSLDLDNPNYNPGWKKDLQRIIQNMQDIS